MMKLHYFCLLQTERYLKYCNIQTFLKSCVPYFHTYSYLPAVLSVGNKITDEHSCIEKFSILFTVASHFFRYSFMKPWDCFVTSWSVMKTGLSLILSSPEFCSLSGTEIQYWRSFWVCSFVDTCSLIFFF